MKVFKSKIQIIFFAVFAILAVASAIGSFFNPGLLFISFMAATMAAATLKCW